MNHAELDCVRTRVGPGLGSTSWDAGKRLKLSLIPLHMTLLIVPICAFLLAAVAAIPAIADLDREEAVAAAQRLTDARVLSVEQSAMGQRLVWRIKVVTPQGQIRVILIDAGSGQVL